MQGGFQGALRRTFLAKTSRSPLENLPKPRQFERETSAKLSTSDRKSSEIEGNRPEIVEDPPKIADQARLTHRESLISFDSGAEKPLKSSQNYAKPRRFSSAITLETICETSPTSTVSRPEEGQPPTG